MKCAEGPGDGAHEDQHHGGALRKRCAPCRVEAGDQDEDRAKEPEDDVNLGQFLCLPCEGCPYRLVFKGQQRETCHF